MNRIVVIEDEQVIRRGLSDDLSFAAYNVLAAADGEDGYRLIRESHPDLVILDLNLTYEQDEVALSSGDDLLFYTDGIIEARNPEDDEFGEDRLIESIRRAAGVDATGLTRSVVQEAKKFSQGHFEDDLTIVAMSID